MVITYRYRQIFYRRLKAERKAAHWVTNNKHDWTEVQVISVTALLHQLHLGSREEQWLFCTKSWMKMWRCGWPNCTLYRPLSKGYTRRTHTQDTHMHIHTHAILFPRQTWVSQSSWGYVSIDPYPERPRRTGRICPYPFWHNPTRSTLDVDSMSAYLNHHVIIRLLLRRLTSQSHAYMPLFEEQQSAGTYARVRTWGIQPINNRVW